MSNAKNNHEQLNRGNPGNRGNRTPQMHPDFPAGVAEPRPSGRRAKWTPELWAQVLQALRVGTPRAVVRQLVGVSESTWKSWISKSDILREEVEQAEAQAHLSISAPLFDRARSQQRPAEFWLKNRWPKEWGRSDIPEGEAESEETNTFVRDRVEAIAAQLAEAADDAV
jgi:hypothetical protein